MIKSYIPGSSRSVKSFEQVCDLELKMKVFEFRSEIEDVEGTHLDLRSFDREWSRVWDLNDKSSWSISRFRFWVAR